MADPVAAAPPTPTLAAATVAVGTPATAPVAAIPGTPNSPAQMEKNGPAEQIITIPKLKHTGEVRLLESTRMPLSFLFRNPEGRKWKPWQER